MRPWFLIAAAPLLLLAGCNTSPGAATPSPSPTPVAIPTPSPSPSPEPSPTPSPTPVPTPFLYVQIVSSDYGDITVQTVAGASCSARAFLPNGEEQGGLSNPQVANANGIAGWSYPTPPTTQTGTGRATVTCTHNGLSGANSSFYPVGT